MKKTFITVILAMWAVTGMGAAIEVDGLIKKTAKPSPDGNIILPYEKVSLNSKGQLVGRTPQEGIVTKDTIVAMGKYNEQKKMWEAAAPVPGGVDADIFKNAPSKMLQVLVRTTDDRKTVLQIFVKQVGGELVEAGPDYDGIIREVGPRSMAVSNVELDDQWNVLKTFGLRGVAVGSDTVIAMGKYNAQEKKWEAGEAIEGGLRNEMFKDPGKKSIFAHFISRDDKQGVTHILITKIGAPSTVAKKVGGEVTKVSLDFDGIIKQLGRGAMAVAHVDVDDQFHVLKTYGIKGVPVGSDTVIAMGKYNAQEKKWEAGEPIEGGLKNEMFKDPGKKTIYAHFISRDDNRGVTHILITKIGAPVKG